MTTPKKNVAYEFYVSVVSTADTGDFQVNPTIAAGDFQVSTDGGAFANLATLPVVTPAGGRAIKINLSAAEMNANKIVFQGVDAAGDEWDDVVRFIDAPDVNITDIVRSTTPGNKLDVNATGEAGMDLGNVSGVLGNANVGWVDSNDRVNVGQWLDQAVTVSATTLLPEVDMKSLVDRSQSAIDLKDFADDGYNPATNKVTGVTLVDNLTTYIGDTPQTGDNFARLGAPAGASVSADIANVPTVAEFNARTLVAASYFDSAVDQVTVSTNNDKTGYSISGTITTLDGLNDPTSAAIATAVFTTAMTESYRGTGATGTLAQLVYEILAHVGEFAIASTIKTTKKLDGLATAKTYTLDDATNPTSITETT